MEEEQEIQEKSGFDKFTLWEKIWYSFILFACLFGVFYISPARLIFNAFVYHNVECTVESARASSSSGSVASRDYYLWIDTTDCGKLYTKFNSSTDGQAARLNEMKGEKITVRMGYLPWDIGGRMINFIVEPEDFYDKS